MPPKRDDDDITRAISLLLHLTVSTSRQPISRSSNPPIVKVSFVRSSRSNQSIKQPVNQAAVQWAGRQARRLVVGQSAVNLCLSVEA